MMRIRAHAIANELAIDASATLFRMLVFLEHQYPSALAHYKTVSIGIPRTRSRFWVIVARRKRAHGSKTTNPQWGYSRLSPASYHYIGIAVFNQARCITNRM